MKLLLERYFGVFLFLEIVFYRTPDFVSIVLGVIIVHWIHVSMILLGN